MQSLEIACKQRRLVTYQQRNVRAQRKKEKICGNIQRKVAILAKLKGCKEGDKLVLTQQVKARKG